MQQRTVIYLVLLEGLLKLSSRSELELSDAAWAFPRCGFSAG